MFILLLIYSVQASRKEPQVITQKLNSTTYYAIMNQIKRLYDNPNSFQILLWKRSDSDHRLYSYTDNDYDTLVQEENKLNGTAGCRAIQKSFPIEQKLRMGLPADEKIFYTDLIVLQNRALIIRNDFTLQEINLSEDQFIKTIQQKKLKIQQSSTSHPIFLQNTINKRIYIISENGGVSIPDWIPLDSTAFFINEEPFKKRSIIYDAFIKNNKIYVACGNEGIDIYLFKDGILKHDNVQLRIDNSHLDAVDISGDDEYLYILDHNHGLYICDYQFKVKFRVPIIKGSDFGHYNNTFFIIAESMTRQDYAVEVFLNFTDNSYYINHYYFDDMQFYDVKVYQNYVVLIGYEVHKIIQHSIYSNFIKFTSNNYFEFPQLLQLKSWNNSIVALSKKQIRLLNLSIIPAHIECESQEIFQEYYLVTSFFQNSSSPFEITKVDQVFRIIIDDVSKLSKANLILFVFLLIIMFIIVWLLIVGFICYKKCKDKTQKLEESKIYLTKQYQIDREEGPGQELSAL
ncbi:unnamed protein product [Paramecium primaurelia]|uniref:Transmembrane protein n=1 Tax=Paramecium primaurelia TaxID=5886 RepID=A0A8S1L421_PARPR|nr:unnamed protein product [Paramecium primaurelia]